jgi:hypothetical protein
MTDDKEARRAAALRANLRKRKAQQRARAEEPADGRETTKEARPPSSDPQPKES